MDIETPMVFLKWSSFFSITCCEIIMWSLKWEKNPQIFVYFKVVITLLKLKYYEISTSCEKCLWMLHAYLGGGSTPLWSQYGVHTTLLESLNFTWQELSKAWFVQHGLSAHNFGIWHKAWSWKVLLSFSISSNCVDKPIKGKECPLLANAKL